MCQFIETIRIEKGNVYNLPYHTERCNRTRKAFWKDAAPIDLRHYITPPPTKELLKCRIVYDETIKEVSYAPYQMKEVSSVRLVKSDTIDYTYKRVDREELNTLYAQRRGADDILIVKDGYLTDTSIANIALFDGHDWFTPRRPLLKGTRRMEFLDRYRIREEDIFYTQLYNYTHLMLFNAMIGWKQILLPIDDVHILSER